jgi:hypothetical protein
MRHAAPLKFTARARLNLMHAWFHSGNKGQACRANMAKNDKVEHAAIAALTSTCSTYCRRTRS